MLGLAAQPSRAGAPGRPGPPGAAGEALQHAAGGRRLRAGLLGVATALAITIPSVLIGVYLRRLYSAGLFLGTPFTIGYISAYVFNARQAQSERHTLEVAVLGRARGRGHAGVCPRR